jgi:cell shape-determining protein MreD
MALFVRMIIIAVNMTLHNNIFRSNSYIILICVMCLWPGLVVDTRYVPTNEQVQRQNFDSECF